MPVAGFEHADSGTEERPILSRPSLFNVLSRNRSNFHIIGLSIGDCNTLWYMIHIGVDIIPIPFFLKGNKVPRGREIKI